MKIQLDTTNKSIKIEEVVNLGELMDTLENLLPNGTWKEFNLETSIINNWINPIEIKPYINPYEYQDYPYKDIINPYQPWITWCETSQKYDIQSGIYNIELK